MMGGGDLLGGRGTREGPYPHRSRTPWRYALRVRYGMRGSKVGETPRHWTGFWNNAISVCSGGNLSRVRIELVNCFRM